MAIIPVNDPTSDDAGKDLVKPLLASIAALKSAKKSAAWVDEMLALREDAEETIGFCSRIFTQLSLPVSYTHLRAHET